MNYVIASALAELAITLDEHEPSWPTHLHLDDDILHLIRIRIIATSYHRTRIPYPAALPSCRASRGKYTPKRRIRTNAPVAAQTVLHSSPRTSERRRARIDRVPLALCAAKHLPAITV
ncbi:hypothetical protein HETIRDRAFT_419865 [Heterobasidion irregulare TC 32-1]|uniref:Uncharacterized protein n=1 Tax=Heterobasidion irregulare (strain TC 32-1) TaxID=747525 RepID=W4K0F4_HETIT|nr:uncharacterized protein HETIRDRAFT_419865 [Heterobasidion irregulare TC 32-1]ETW78611.1 hypothetical protein HETIRDRAFT_419865 [Heterobasidion irregulare TC 32-1]